MKIVKLLIILVVLGIGYFSYQIYTAESNAKREDPSHVASEGRDIMVTGNGVSAVTLAPQVMKIIVDKEEVGYVPLSNVCLESLQGYMSEKPTVETLRSLSEFLECSEEDLNTKFQNRLQFAFDDFSKKVLFRSLLIDYFTAHIPLEWIGTETLLHKLYAQRNVDEGNVRLKIADELDKRGEFLDTAASIRADSFLRGEIDLEKKDLIGKMVQGLIASHNKFTLLAVQKRFKEDGFETKEIESYFEKLDVKDALYYISKAISAHRDEGDHKQTIGFLKKALEKKPKNFLIKSSLKSYIDGSQPEIKTIVKVRYYSGKRQIKRPKPKKK